MPNTEFRKNNHSIYNLKFHLVLVTKYRKKCITKEMLSEIKEVFDKLLTSYDCALMEFNGEDDHVHLLFESPPQIQLTKLINSLKTISAKTIRKDFKEYLQKYYWKPVFWSRSYCILSTGGSTIEIIERYIRNQGSENC